mgnify:FL=1
MPQRSGRAVYGTSRLSLVGERKGGIMRRLFILLTVCTLILSGCSGQSKQLITESQSVETTSQVEETVSTEIEETEVVETVEVESTEESVQTDAEESKVEPEPTTEPEKPQQEAEQSKPEETTPSQEEKPEPEPPVSTEAPTPAPTEPEQPKEEPTEAPAEVETVSYDPYEVVSLATAKTKAYGKISIPEDLDNMLANGEITKEEYDEYYPYDGAGYYSVFVETDLNQAATTSGRKLGSVDGIASYIAEMLSLETGPYFYIEYAGVHSINGTDFYEFRCYRA